MSQHKINSGFSCSNGTKFYIIVDAGTFSTFNKRIYDEAMKNGFVEISDEFLKSGRDTEEYNL
jgi:hypothetical protein